jgi:glycosyltransferase involved in cell wall biosynthesis
MPGALAAPCRLVLYSPVHFERWDWRTATERGIGGSETSHVEMAWRLAARGWPVVSYAPLPNDGSEWRGTTWRRLEDVDWSLDGLWVLYRCPSALDHLGPRRAAQPRWLMCQDEGYAWTAEQCERVDRVLALCPAHARAMARAEPRIADRIVLASNGVKVDLIRELAQAPAPPRDPHRLMWASSPDRGLLCLLGIFRRVREAVPTATLHAYYGLDNMRKLADRIPGYRTLVGEIEAAIAATPGVAWHGRVSQPALYDAWRRSAVWCYPTEFTETSCITAMEAQALGAIPVVNPRWALADNVRHGIFVRGQPYSDALVRARFAAAVIGLLLDESQQEAIRRPMMDEARLRTNWEREVDRWEHWMRGDDRRPGMWTHQAAFQRRWAEGRVLNVGADVDAAAWAAAGAVNVDIAATNAWLRQPTAAHLLADGRGALPFRAGAFQTVILGDVLEHLDDAGCVAMLAEARRVAGPGGRVVVTVADDPRPPDLQHVGAGLTSESRTAPGIRPHHWRRIPAALMLHWIREAQLRPIRCQTIDYGHFLGHGAVAVSRVLG